ncbi:MAG TPA: glycosyltransferase family 2 protein [Gemmatimonadaceae bacterium]|jgi:glycosyltransferase involved in cell wall biosynthesis|nr:glycosyltransferase family 2 protein [Gemmatimonadaceae bacterium]
MNSISVVIPCYNASAHLAEALESVLLQTRQPKEIIVVDDRSTDDSVAIARRFPVRVVQLRENVGCGAARNEGYRAATGDVVANLDGDDRWEPNHLEVLGGLFDAHPDAGVAATGVRYFGGQDKPRLPRMPDGVPQMMFWECFRATPVPSPSSGARRSALLEVVGTYNDRHGSAEDFGRWLWLSLSNKFVGSHQITGLYRWHDAQLSSRPELQRVSMHRYRLELIAHLWRIGQDDVAAEAERRELAYWTADLRDMWQGRHVEAMRGLLSLAPQLPGASARLVRTYERRASLSPLIARTWDRMPLGARGVVKRLVAAVR